MELISEIPAGVWAVIGTIVAGISLKVAEKVLSSRSQTLSENQYYREAIADLRSRLDTVEEQVDEWRSKYHEAQATISELRIKVIKLSADMDDDDV